MAKNAKKKSRSQAAKRAYQVFVSHATADKWIAKTICEKIEATAKATTFRDDRDIAGGDDIPDTIRGEIARSKEFLVLLTPKSINRPWVLLETGAAWARGPRMRIVALLYHVDFEPIPDMIKSKKLFELNDFDRYLEELADRVEKQS